LDVEVHANHLLSTATRSSSQRHVLTPMSMSLKPSRVFVLLPITSSLFALTPQGWSPISHNIFSIKYIFIKRNYNKSASWIWVNGIGIEIECSRIEPRKEKNPTTVDNSGYQKKKGSTNNNIHLSTKIKYYILLAALGAFASGLGVTIANKYNCCNSYLIRNRSSTSDRNWSWWKIQLWWLSFVVVICLSHYFFLCV
jgi:hypothetical protein